MDLPIIFTILHFLYESSKRYLSTFLWKHKVTSWNSFLHYPHYWSYECFYSFKPKQFKADFLMWLNSSVSNIRPTSRRSDTLGAARDWTESWCLCVSRQTNWIDLLLELTTWLSFSILMGPEWVPPLTCLHCLHQPQRGLALVQCRPANAWHVAYIWARCW